jgi:hypothetical protein
MTNHTLLVYPAIVRSADGHDHVARACGHERADEKWEAWLEFEPVDGGETLRTPREGTEHDRASLFAWAQAITPVYLEGALVRATSGESIDRPPAVRAPAFDCLDPFEVWEHGRGLLRRCLEGLSVLHLRHVAVVHHMVDAEIADELTKEELVHLIDSLTQLRMAGRDEARPM